LLTWLVSNAIVSNAPAMPASFGGQSALSAGRAPCIVCQRHETPAFETLRCRRGIRIAAPSARMRCAVREFEALGASLLSSSFGLAIQVVATVVLARTC